MNEHKWKGSGDVVTNAPIKDTLVFDEQGVWELQRMNFSNTFRWVLDRKNDVISLEHLRFGPNKPQFLLYLTPNHEGLTSITPHLCGADVYHATLSQGSGMLQLHWEIIGPKKHESMQCHYF